MLLEKKGIRGWWLLVCGANCACWLARNLTDLHTPRVTL